MVACLQASAFGQTGLTVAKLSLGTVKFGRKEGLKYPHPVSLPDDRAAQTLLDGARSGHNPARYSARLRQQRTSAGTALKRPTSALADMH